mmetsp:Transcript_11056/g.35087  ORF Transcript_11056/g.35087 Transcript_11056/m.35087 type:complete len:518 (-) Transcript_11056:124-1677(-)
MIALLLLVAPLTLCRNVYHKRSNSNFLNYNASLESSDPDGSNYAIMSSAEDEEYVIIPYIEWNIQMTEDGLMFEQFVCAVAGENAGCEEPRILRLFMSHAFEVAPSVATSDVFEPSISRQKYKANLNTLDFAVQDLLVEREPEYVYWKGLVVDAGAIDFEVPIARETSRIVGDSTYPYTARSDELAVFLTLRNWPFSIWVTDSEMVLAWRYEYLVDGVATPVVTDDTSGSLRGTDVFAGIARMALDIVTHVDGTSSGARAEVTFNNTHFLIRLPDAQSTGRRYGFTHLQVTLKTDLDCEGLECGGMCGTCPTTHSCFADARCHEKRVAGTKTGDCRCNGAGFSCCEYASCNSACLYRLSGVTGVPVGKTCCGSGAGCGCEEIYSLTYCGDGTCDDNFENHDSCPDDCEGEPDLGDGESDGEGEGDVEGEGEGEGSSEGEGEGGSEGEGEGTDGDCSTFSTSCPSCYESECEMCDGSCVPAGECPFPVDECGDEPGSEPESSASTSSASRLSLFGKWC